MRCRFLCSRSPHDEAVVARRAQLKPITASLCRGWRLFLTGEGKKEEKRVKRFLRGFMNYGLVAAILVATALVGVLAYRLEGSSWRWPLAALVLAGLGTIAGIFWIKKYVDRQTKASEQGNQQ